MLVLDVEGENDPIIERWIRLKDKDAHLLRDFSIHDTNRDYILDFLKRKNRYKTLD
jgi:hypothetical protein